MEGKWTPSVLDDLDEARKYVTHDHLGAAERMADRVIEAVEFLLGHPRLGRPGRVGSTHELVVSGTPFIIVYRTAFDEVQILRVLHHAQRWPP